jgi:hypothetical protein
MPIQCDHKWCNPVLSSYYCLVDKYIRQPRLMKLTIINIGENYLSSDVISIALP